MAKRVEIVVIHCTATPQDRAITKEMLEAMGRKRGWVRQPLGYRGIFHQSGEYETLVEDNGDEYIDPWEITNGVKGKNDIAEHYAYAGGVKADGVTPEDTRTSNQRAAMLTKILHLIKKYPWIKIAGHYQFANKACPSFNVEQWLRTYGIPEKNIY